MNYTNKDFYARISRIENLNFSGRREAELHLAQEGSVKISMDGPGVSINERFESVSRCGQNIQAVSVNSRATTTLSKNAGSVANNSKANNTTSTSESSFVVVAITEGRGHAEGEIGLAAMDINSPSLILSQIGDAFWYRDILLKIEILCPSEILVPLTVYNAGTKLMDEIKTLFPSTTITPIPRRYFSDSEIFNTLQGLCTSSCKNVLNVVSKKYYAMSAAAGLLAYVKNILVVNFLPNSLRIEYQNRSSRVFIDYECYHRLELLYSLAETKEKRCCLYGFLNNTVTTVGARCLRAFILEPHSQLQKISEMQNCIKELLSNRNLMFEAQECLKKFACCDQLLKLCVLPPEDDKIKSIEILINRVLLLKSTLENIPDFCNIIMNCKSDVFKKLLNVLNDARFEIMLNEIRKVIQPEINSVKSTAQCFQRIYAIKSGICEYLDFMRDIYSKLVEQMRSTVNDAATKYGLPLRMIYSIAKGFHMQFTSTNKTSITSIPAGLDTIYQKGNNYYLTNSELYKLNVRMSDVIDELHLASYRVARNLVEVLLSNADASYELIGAISNFDIVLSLAKVSSRDGYCCPSFGNEMRVVDAVYPFLEFTPGKPTPVPNNIIGTPEYNFYIITGPNMGGKTLYIKTIAIIQIIAQLGCYVPAKEASFKICDRIFTRIGFEDRVEKDSSSFVKEMKEFQYILDSITPNSLILIDEICRNTNPEEGKSIAFKVCQKLAGVFGKQDLSQEKNFDAKPSSEKIKPILKLQNSTAPFIYLTTHFMELTKLTDDYLNISNLYLDAEEKILEDKVHLTYKHKVMEGVTPIKGYGLALARTIRFPRQVLHRAEEIYEKLLIEEKNFLQRQDPIPQSSRQRILPLLEQSLRNPTQSTQSSVNTKSLHTVAGFINTSVAHPSQATQARSMGNNSLADLTSELYDIFAQIMSAFRSQSKNFDSLCNHLIKNFLERQPQELLDAIYKIESKEFEGMSSFKLNFQSNHAAQSSHSETNAQGDTDLLDLSYHSLVRRLGCDPNNFSFASSSANVSQLATSYQGEADEWMSSLSSNFTGSFPFQTPEVQTCPSYLLTSGEGRNRPLIGGCYTFPYLNKSATLNSSMSLVGRRSFNAVDFLEISTHTSRDEGAMQNVGNENHQDTRESNMVEDLTNTSTEYNGNQSKLIKLRIKGKSKSRTVWRNK